MTGLAVGAFLLGAYLILALPDGGNGRAPAKGIARFSAWRRTERAAEVDPAELPMFVHQLTALLHMGRSPHQLWHDIAVMYSPGEASPGRGATAAFARQAQPVLMAAQQAAAIGVGVPEVLRDAAMDSPGGGSWWPGRSRTPPADCASLWRDLALCLDISERSGAPLAEVLNRYAAQLEMALDSATARATALAGPAATARLLGWLPLFGLGLGYLAGAQPLTILLGSLPGLVLLAAGLSLMVLGRLWTGRLVAAATGNG